MSSLLLWLSPVAKEVLSTTVQLLQGKVPSPTASLSSALKQASSDDCLGLLVDSNLRSEFAKELDSSSLKEISAASSKQLVEIFGQVLNKQLDALKKQASKVAAKLPKSSPLSFDQVLGALNGQEPSQALRTDWVLWHYMGCSHFAKEMPCLPAEVVNARIGLVSCNASDALIECALKAHILEHLDAYQAWEASMAANQAQEVKNGLHNPFDAGAAKQVALRRALGHALPLEVADSAAKAEKAPQALQSMAEEAKSRVVLPSYLAPVAAKEKDPKESGKKRKADAPSASPGVDAGTFGKAHASAETQEYRWHLLAYSLRPGTTLGAADPSKSSSSKAPAQKTAKGTENRPSGFGGTWAPLGGTVPPGHTDYSWYNAQSGTKEGFSTIWAAKDLQCPPGHTPYSWQKAMGGASAPSAPAPNKVKANQTEKVETAAKAKPAKAPAAPAAPSAPADGKEAALAKIDLRCGRILECSKVPDADSLYLLKINIGEDQPRQVVSSLVGHYTADELQNRQVVVYCNIKPGKMRGLESQAMVLAATKNKGEKDEICELLDPPAGCAEGTRPLVGELEVGSASDGVSVKYISKVWGQVQPSLNMNEKGEASFDGTPLMMKEGPVRAKSLTKVGIY